MNKLKVKDLNRKTLNIQLFIWPQLTKQLNYSALMHKMWNNMGFLLCPKIDDQLKLQIHWQVSQNIDL
jgi:hypothetical protein